MGIRPQRLRRVALVIALTVVAQLSVFALFATVYRAQPPTAPLSRALVQELASPDPALIDATAWQPVTLPRKLCAADCESRFKVYRLEFDAPRAADIEALYIRTVDGAMAAYINGKSLGQTGSLVDPVADMTYQPAYFEFAEDSITSSTNTLDIVVASLVAPGGRLTEPFVGKRSVLSKAHRVAHGVTVDMLTLINGILAVFLFAAISFYVLAERDRLFLWFALVLVLAMVRNANVLLPEWPADIRIRSAIYLCTTLGVLLASAAFVQRLVRGAVSKIDRWFVLFWLLLCVPIVVGVFVDVWSTWTVAVSLTRVATVLVGGTLLLSFLVRSATYPAVAQAAIIALLAAGFALTLHDTVMSQPPRLLYFQFANLAALPFVLSFCVALAVRYRVSEASRVLSEHERHVLLGAERRRILRDVHDGVGGRLTTLLHRVRRDPSGTAGIADELQLSLNDLHVIIDSLDEAAGRDLGLSLGRLRERIEPWLAIHGVVLDWRVRLPESIFLSAESILHVLRIIQEALNNVLKHAAASRVRVSAETIDHSIRIEVSDDGRGMTKAATTGRGLSIMRERAAAVGGQLDVVSGSNGTRVLLGLPHPPPVNAGVAPLAKSNEA